jgi:hypothetical protein
MVVDDRVLALRKRELEVEIAQVESVEMRDCCDLRKMPRGEQPIVNALDAKSTSSPIVYRLACESLKIQPDHRPCLHLPT